MMFLLRTAFWISVALALLPSFVSKQPTAAAAKIDATGAMTAATDTVADVGGFCDRRPQACAAGAQLAIAFGERAQEGAKIVYDFIGAKIAKSDRDGGTDGVATKSADGKAVEAKPVATASAEVKQADAKPVETKSVDTKPIDAKPSRHTLTASDVAVPWRGPPPARRDATGRRAT